MNLKKFKLFTSTIFFFIFIMSVDGLQVDPSKIFVILE